MSGARQISFEDAPFSAIHKKITAGTFMGQISDGYTLGIVGISLNYAMEPLGLTSFWMGLIGAGSMFGIFFGSLLAGITADKIGRRPLYASLMLLTAIVSVLQFFLSDPLLIAIVRFVLGMLIGADYTVGIPLLSEWAPAKKRAGILGWLLVFWTIGYCISYIVGFFMDGFVAAFGNQTLLEDAVIFNDAVVHDAHPRGGMRVAVHVAGLTVGSPPGVPDAAEALCQSLCGQFLAQLCQPPLALYHADAAVQRQRNPRRIVPAVLQFFQTVQQHILCAALADITNNATHTKHLHADSPARTRTAAVSLLR